MKASNIKPIAHMKTHAASYEQMQDALILLTILSQSDAEYRKGHWKSQEQVEAGFRKRFPD